MPGDAADQLADGWEKEATLYLTEIHQQDLVEAIGKLADAVRRLESDEVISDHIDAVDLEASQTFDWGLPGWRDEAGSNDVDCVIGILKQAGDLVMIPHLGQSPETKNYLSLRNRSEQPRVGG